MITIETDNPRELVNQINRAIRTGKTSLWDVDKDGDYFLQQVGWAGKGWMRPVTDDTAPRMLRIVIIEPIGQKLLKSTYSVLHCRFAEMILTLFDTQIEKLSITPLLTEHDLYSNA